MCANHNTTCCVSAEKMKAPYGVLQMTFEVLQTRTGMHVYVSQNSLC